MHKHRFALPSDTSAPERARRALESLGDLLDPRAADVHLLATELVAISLNSTRSESGKPIALSVELSDSAIRIEVSDDADVFDRVPVLFHGPDDRLKLIDEIADRWGITQGDEPNIWCMLERANG